LALLLAGPGLAHAQTTSTLCGTVTDASGAAVPGVTVTMARNAETPNVVTATSATGDFVLSNVLTGTYTLSFELRGFKKAVRPGLVVQASRELRVDQRLEPASTGVETVEVTEVPLGDNPRVTGLVFTKTIVTNAVPRPPRPCGAPR
jgi:hypothetical protein